MAPRKTPARKRVRSPITRAARERFLAHLGNGHTIKSSAAAAAPKVPGTKAWYRLRKTDAEFAELWDEALEEGIQQLEEEARRRAVEGVTVPIMYRGEQVASVQEFSDTLLIFLLKAKRPEVYRDRHHVEHHGLPAAEVKLTFDPSPLVGSAEALGVARNGHN
jgi:hypothetical protein